jgi:hypothetical protein
MVLIIRSKNLSNYVYKNKLKQVKNLFYFRRSRFFKKLVKRYLSMLFFIKNNLILIKNNIVVSSSNRRSFFKKLIKYKRLINQVNYLKINCFNSLFLVNHFIYLGNFTVDLLKEYFYSKVYEFCKYKYNFEPILLTKLVQNYIYTYKIHKLSNKNILLKVSNNMIEVFNYLDFLKQLTLVPYNFIPFSLISLNKHISLYLSNCYNNFFCYKYNKTNYNFLNFFYIEKIKKIIISLIIFITKKIIITIA